MVGVDGRCRGVVAEKKPHIKKPLNAFMLYMKEMRAKVVAECTLKESAAINQILGRKVGAACLFAPSHLITITTTVIIITTIIIIVTSMIISPAAATTTSTLFYILEI